MTTDIATFITTQPAAPAIPTGIAAPFSGGARNTIIHGDCIDVLPRLPAGSVDFVLTDPPYLVHYRSRDGRHVPNDDNDTWLKPAFAEMYRVLASDSFAVSFYGWPHADKFVAAWRVVAAGAGDFASSGTLCSQSATHRQRASCAISMNARICWRRATRSSLQ